MVDQRFLPRIDEGEARFVMIGPVLNRVEHYVYIGGVGGETKTTIHKPADEGFPYTEIQKKLQDEVPTYLKALGLPQSALPLLWAADFIPVDNHKSPFVIGEFNCSCLGLAGFLNVRGKDISELKDEDRDLGMKMANLIGQKALEALEKAKGLTMDVLKAQDDKTSGAIIEFCKDNATFQALAKKEMDQIIARDNEDGEKLQAGVNEAIKKGVLPADLTPPTYTNVEVQGKDAGTVADEIIAQLPKEGGCVMVLVGLSGTGKGTTVDKLKAKLPKATTWSNGNVFRSLTLLAATHCEQEQKGGFDPAVLTAENLSKWVGMLEFNNYDGKFDIRINGLGMDVKVSDVANTLLKEPKVATNIPVVAKETQGEVVKFAGDAMKKMGEAGAVVLVEGRQQTLDFIPSQYRFCLTMSDPTVIGARRAAQRIAADVAGKIKDGDDVGAVVNASVDAISKA